MARAFSTTDRMCTGPWSLKPRRLMLTTFAYSWRDCTSSSSSRISAAFRARPFTRERILPSTPSCFGDFTVYYLPAVPLAQLRDVGHVVTAVPRINLQRALQFLRTALGMD